MKFMEAEKKVYCYLCNLPSYNSIHYKSYDNKGWSYIDYNLFKSHYSYTTKANSTKEYMQYYMYYIAVFLGWALQNKVYGHQTHWEKERTSLRRRGRIGNSSAALDYELTKHAHHNITCHLAIGPGNYKCSLSIIILL